MSGYRYVDPEDGAVLDISEGRDSTDTFAYVKTHTANGTNHVLIVVRPFSRKEAAAALAGPDYRVVPRDLTVGDLAQIARDAGVRLDMDLEDPLDPLRRKLHESDRPEPVDPASVRVVQISDAAWPGAVSDGLTLECARCDYVPRIDYRVGDEAWRKVVDEADRLGVVCLECYLALGGSPSDIEELQVTQPGETILLQPVVVYRYPAEPEPDEAAVEALADGLVEQYQTIQNGKWRDAARALIRDHGVHVEVPNA